MNRIRILVFAVLAVLVAKGAFAQVPQIINCQGRVSLNATNFNGTGQFKFALVNGTGAATYWSNGNNTVSLPVTAGLYSVLLGDTTVSNMAAIPTGVFTNSDVRLRIWFNGGLGLQQLSPDQRLAAVGYALMASSVPDGAITSSKLATGAVTAVAIANNAITASNIATGAITSANIAANTITAANMAPGVGLVPTSGIVLSQTASNSALTAAGYTPVTTGAPPGTWTLATNAAAWSARYGFATLSFNGKMWLLGGYDGNFRNDVWSSTDGAVWTQVTNSAPWTARAFIGAACFNGKMWLMGGGNSSPTPFNDVWSSSDGLNWTLATNSAAWTPRFLGPVVVTNNNRMWLLGGNAQAGTYYHDVWSSTNGVNWTLATNAAPWAARTLGAAVSFNGQMWLMGGNTGGSSDLDDVWSSTNGANWAQVTNAAAWTPRYGHVALVNNGQMWVLGGFDGSVRNDVWSSADGANWTQVTNVTPWSVRDEGGGVVFNGQMWMIGGFGGTNLNDVWSSSVSTPVTFGGFYLYQKQANGLTNTALQFDGIQNYVSAPGGQAFFANAITVEGWVKTTSTNREFFFGNYSTVNPGGYDLHQEDSTHLQFDFANLISLNVPASIHDGNWHHVAGVWNGTTASIFADGVLIGSEGTSAPQTNIAAFVVGGGGEGPLPGNSPFNGTIDEVRVSSVARYSANFTPATSFTADGNTIALWEFNEGTGTAANDSTGNHNATLQGSPLPSWVAGR